MDKFDFEQIRQYLSDYLTIEVSNMGEYLKIKLKLEDKTISEDSISLSNLQE